MRPIDLHGHSPESALRLLGQELHSARVRGETEVLVITGRGIGNRSGQPILRGHVEEWLRGQGGERYGVVRFTRSRDGGSLRVELTGGRPRPTAR